MFLSPQGWWGSRVCGDRTRFLTFHNPERHRHWTPDLAAGFTSQGVLPWVGLRKRRQRHQPSSISGKREPAVREKDTRVKAKRCSFGRDSDLRHEDGLCSSDPGACGVARKLLQGNVEFLPRTNFHLDWSRWAQMISWKKTLYLKNIPRPMSLSVKQKINTSNC